MLHRARGQRYGRFSEWFGRTALRLLRYELVGACPETVKKCVVIGAPHDSAWDVFYMFLARLGLGLPMTFMMKDSLDRWPFRTFWRVLGGIPVNRSESTNIVQQAVQMFAEHDSLYLLIAPEGTRRKVEHWRTGFYWIAHGSGVPILLAFINYRDRRLGLGSFLYPTGDIAQDFEALREFYELQTGIVPRYSGT
ncbi:MAG: 1-acyl-sn-glycerol-3-phosphate acyltransferase [Candidatus Hydrogenedentes bacterium]|nr:1-acyl-sn-glycerol-3-phosphate acyltransferase [Candidatus Hydrogenedentota bacterium]